MKDLGQIIQGLPKGDIQNLIKLAKSPYFDSILKFNANMVFQVSLMLADKSGVKTMEDVRFNQGYIAGVNELVNNLESLVEGVREKQERETGEPIMGEMKVAESFASKLRNIFDKNIKVLLRLGKN